MSAVPDDTYLMRTYCVTEPGKYRLACFPHILDPPGYYLGISGLLLPTVEVLPFQYLEAGGDGAPTRIRDIEDLADQASVSLMEWTDLPMALFGHRSGAYLAYRVAQRMERAGGPAPAALFVADRRAPAGEDRRAADRLSCRIVALAGDSAEEPPGRTSSSGANAPTAPSTWSCFPVPTDCWIRTSGRSPTSFMTSFSVPLRRSEILWSAFRIGAFDKGG